MQIIRMFQGTVLFIAKYKTEENGYAYNMAVQ